MLKAVDLGSCSLSYDLQRKRIKNINLRIHADGSILVSAPSRVPVGVIEDFIRTKGDYILSTLDRFAQKAPAPRNYDKGERLSVLGREYVLDVIPAKKNCADMGGGVIKLYVKDAGDALLREKTLDKLLDALCEETVKGLCDEIYPLFAKRGVAYPEIKLRRMKSRWGSCASGKGLLTFNKVLVYAPMDCVEYVVYHEFVHFLHPNHSPDFYACLAQYVPDWKERRKRLSEYSSYIKR